MNQIEKAQLLNTLHVPGAPLVLYNIWDAGGAMATDNDTISKLLQLPDKTIRDGCSS